jgi:hypothetical protein
MTKLSSYINVTDRESYDASEFEPTALNPFFSLKQLFPDEDHLYFDYDAFGDLIWGSPNAVSHGHQDSSDRAKNGSLLEVDDSVFKE